MPEGSRDSAYGGIHNTLVGFITVKVLTEPNEQREKAMGRNLEETRYKLSKVISGESHRTRLILSAMSSHHIRGAAYQASSLEIECLRFLLDGHIGA